MFIHKYEKPLKRPLYLERFMKLWLKIKCQWIFCIAINEHESMKMLKNNVQGVSRTNRWIKGVRFFH